MTEKLENCPMCGEGSSKFWLYDFQRCNGCGHDGMNIGFNRMEHTPAVKDMMRERTLGPDGWLIINPSGKRRVVDASKWDASKAEFWISGEIPDGTQVFPLNRGEPISITTPYAL